MKETYKIDYILDNLDTAKRWIDYSIKTESQKAIPIAIQSLIYAAEWSSKITVYDDGKAAMELVEEVRQYMNNKIFW